MTVTVRAATAADAPDLAELTDQVAAEELWIRYRSPLDREQWSEDFTARLEDDANCELVAERGGAIIGYLMSNSFRGIVDLGMYVAAEARGTGAGSALLEGLFAWAATNGCHKVTLQVWPHNGPAIRLYERFGFEHEGRLRRHWKRPDGALWDSLIMSRILDERTPSSPHPDALTADGQQEQQSGAHQAETHP